jgi:hypothetical protein
MTFPKTSSLTLLSFLALCSIAAVAEDNQAPAGFVSLFNGQDMTGWKADPEGHWKADGGVMVYDGKAKSLASDKEFGDFILRIDWKIEKGGNSGIFLRGESQVEIWDNPSMGSGGIYPQAHKPLKVADKPAGQWNQFEIKVEKGLVTVQLNGELVLDQFDGRFKKAAGPFVLQHHGTPLWFKNIYIKELK